MIRNRQIDVLRGVAIILMVIDHVAFVYFPSWWSRIPGRFAMPLFFMISGSLGPGRDPSRLFMIICLAVALMPFENYIGFKLPGVLSWWLLSYGLMILFDGYELQAVILALISTQLIYMPGQVHFGLMFAFMILGKVWRRILVNGDLKEKRLEFIGRWPMTIYAGHVVALAILK